jgi:hypothetical protein
MRFEPIILGNRMMERGDTFGHLVNVRRPYDSCFYKKRHSLCLDL